MRGGCLAEHKTDNYSTGENEALMAPSQLSRILANFQNLYLNCSHTEEAVGQKNGVVCWALEFHYQNHCYETHIRSVCFPHWALLSWDTGAGLSVPWA